MGSAGAPSIEKTSAHGVINGAVYAKMGFMGDGNLTISTDIGLNESNPRSQGCLMMSQGCCW